MSRDKQAGYGIPVAIVIAGILIAGTVFWSNKSGSGPPQGELKQASAPGASADAFRPPDKFDHVRGNLLAKISIVEFADLECPFCARLHPTLERIVEENDDVKWIYRHFPLSSIHSRALSAAIASECVAKLGGNETFWKFVDAVFSSQHRLGNSLYQELGASYGIDIDTFNSCLKDGSVLREVQADLSEVIKLGGRGTPFSVVLTARGSLVPFSGALPYENVVNLIEQARNN